MFDMKVYYFLIFRLTKFLSNLEIILRQNIIIVRTKNLSRTNVNNFHLKNLYDISVTNSDVSVV